LFSKIIYVINYVNNYVNNFSLIFLPPPPKGEGWGEGCFVISKKQKPPETQMNPGGKNNEEKLIFF